MRSGISPKLLVALAIAFCLNPAPAAELPARAALAIEHVTVVDVAGGELSGPCTVLIVGGKIHAIGDATAVSVPPGATRVDGRGRYLIPGLVDMHVHLFNNSSRRPPNEWTFPLFIANGVTGVREMWTEPSSMGVVNRWRAQVAGGDLIAPRVLAAGAAVRAENPATARAKVREAKAAGSDFIKIFTEVAEAPWRAILDEARALKLPVVGHIPGGISLLASATAGQRGNEHLTQAYEACSPREQEWLDSRAGLPGPAIAQLAEKQEREVLESFDQSRCDQLASALARTGQVQVPTLVLAHFEARGARTEFRDDPRWRYLRADEQVRWDRILRLGEKVEMKLVALRRDISLRIVRTMHAAGVRILAGTDAPMPLGYPGFSLHAELELLVEAGLTPAEALRAATLWPAEFLGMAATRGSVAAGQDADLVLLDENPLTDIRHAQRIRAVVLAGRWLPRSELDSLLASAAVKVSPDPANAAPDGH